MKIPQENFKPLILALVLSVIFSFSVIFLMFTVVSELDSFFDTYISDPWYAQGGEYQQVKEEYERMVTYLTPIGYLSFFLTCMLVLFGIIIKRYNLSFFGSLALYLPIFGYFSGAMTAMFAGIGVLRAIWIPLLDLAPEVLNLGAILFIPVLLSFFIYFSMSSLLETLEPLLGPYLSSVFYYILLFSVVIIGFGIFIFGVMTWMYGKFQGKKVIDFWIYSYSRHPQYLGIIIWNYGLLVTSFFPFVRIPPPTFPLLLLTLVIMGMAVNEENKMSQKYSEDYISWRDRTAFLIPLPNWVKSIIHYPMRKTIKKEWPENNKEIIGVLLIYGTLVVILSFPFRLIY